MSWVLKRLSQAGVTVFGVLTLSFILSRVMPGGPQNTLAYRLEQSGLDQTIVQQRVQQFLRTYPDEPIHIAYVNYMSDMLHGQFGVSIWSQEPVAAHIAEVAPWTIFIMSWASFLGFFVGIVLGALMAYYEGGKLDVGLTSYAMVMGSVPYYVFAIYLILILGIQWGLFPYSGRMTNGTVPGFNWPFIAGVLDHAALPILSLVLSGSLASLSMRGNSIRVLGEPYLRVARLRGLPDRTIAVQYVARNAILPLYTGFVISLGSMIGGSVILETLFSYRGMGLLLVNSVNRRDVPMMMGIFNVITVCVVLALIFADLTYSKIDPRTEGQTDEF